MQLTDVSSRRRTGRIIGAVVVLAAVVAGIAVWRETNVSPRTDDATVRANLIGISPEISGPIVQLHVKDNQFVQKGDLLFEIDPRPFEYALAKARSDLDTLEKQIVDEQRKISSQQSGVASARARVASSESNIVSAEASITAARANVSRAEAAVATTEAEYKLATDTLHRLEPLLAKQFVTVDQVDRARTAQATTSEAVRQSRSQLALAQAQLQSAVAQRSQASAGVQQTQAQLQESVRSVTTLEPLTAQRLARTAAIQRAELDLQHTRVYAPFDARVTGMNLSEGAYAHAGQQVFTLIDTRTWWVVGNFRESQLSYIRPGMTVDVYVMLKPDRRFEGTVDSASFGVYPEDGGVAQGLPQVQRSLNWVHLATRFPVRIRVTNPDPELFRIGESAVVIVRGSGLAVSRQARR